MRVLRKLRQKKIDMKTEYSVKPITRLDCTPYIMKKHYAKRFPSVSYAYGLFRGRTLLGCITFGSPAGATVRKGIAGEKHAENVIELNRLCLRDNRKNEASILVSRAIKLLRKPKIIISYADTSQGHQGIVYQACNFIYLGLSAKRTDWKVKGKENLHGQTIADEFRGVKNRADLMRQKYGDDFWLSPRPRKHRYVFLHGPKTWRKKVLDEIRYEQKKYPKPEMNSELVGE